MKKFSLLLLMVMLFPLSVRAKMDYSEEFHVGDSVNVALYSDEETPNNEKNGNGFHVIKESKAGEQYVTMIYDGVVSGSPTVYDELIPGQHEEVTSVYEKAVIGQKLQSAVSPENGSQWRVLTAGLLSASDLSDLGITKNAEGVYEIPEKYSFLAPIKLAGLQPEMYNYWTSIQDTSADTLSMYCVTYNEERTTDTGVWATLVSKDITSITNSSTCAIRPVVVVDKEYILCNNSKKTETPKNVSTGVEDYILPLTVALVLAGVAVVFVKRNTLFKEI